MNRKLVAGNWKMNLLRRQAERLSADVVSVLGCDYSRCQVVLAPPYTSLDSVRRSIEGSTVELGAQNVYEEPYGAFTGEVSPEMLSDAGCRWVIVGHSERRRILGETDNRINKKLLLCFRCKLSVILCVGETAAQREKAVAGCGKNNALRRRLLFEPIRMQLERGLGGVSPEMTSDIVIAYEPLWAIGTGRNATSREITEISLWIRGFLSDMFSDSGSNIRILYGGSVSAGNIHSIMSVDQVSGVLVGGASLSADSFSEIVKSVGG